jgi:trehalose 6-phosphate synthase
VRSSNIVNSSPSDQQVSENSSDALDGYNLVIASNREPYQHNFSDDGIDVVRPNGGLTSGLDGVMQKVGGTWIAWGDSEADRAVVDEANQVSVPPDGDEDQYTLQRIWLTQEEVDNYYLGFSNRVLWPICHGALTQVENEREYWEQYRNVNRRFADAIADRADENSVVWLQDYHLGLVPKMLRSRDEEMPLLAQFWHIPWPGPDTFRACPQGEKILRGLLGNDMLGFHLDRYCENFLDCVEEMIPEASVDRETGHVYKPGNKVTVRSFPLGVEVDRIQAGASDDAASDRWARFAGEHGIDLDSDLALGVDRLDYTKGIPERLHALERLWEDRPDLRETFTYVQIGTESRSQIPAYQELQQEVAETVDRINERFGTDDWQPVVYTTAYVSNEVLFALYRRADVALVSPIRDGMNLVAQEYVAAQVDCDGVLVLSEQAGYHDLVEDDVITVTPQNTDKFASAIADALSMPDEERRRHMESLRREIQSRDLDVWIDDVLDEIAALREAPDGE